MFLYGIYKNKKRHGRIHSAFVTYQPHHFCQIDRGRLHDSSPQNFCDSPRHLLPRPSKSLRERCSHFGGTPFPIGLISLSIPTVLMRTAPLPCYSIGDAPILSLSIRLVKRKSAFFLILEKMLIFLYMGRIFFCNCNKKRTPVQMVSTLRILVLPETPFVIPPVTIIRSPVRSSNTRVATHFAV